MRALLLLALCSLALSVAAQTAAVKRLLEHGAQSEEAGRLDDAARDYAAAGDLAEGSGDRLGFAHSAAAIGYLRYYRGDLNQALVDLQLAYESFSALGNDKGRREALENIAHVYADARIAQYPRAIEYYRQLLPDYEKAGEAESVADTLFNIGSTYEQQGDAQTALDWFRRALTAEEKLGRASEAAYVKRSIGVSLGKLGRFDEALPLFDDALRTFEAANETERAMAVRQSRGIVLRKLGRLDAAIADLEATRDWYASHKNTRFLEKSQDELALAYAAAGRWSDAYRTRTVHEALERELAVKLREENTSRLRVQFDSEKKEQENLALLRDAAAAARIRRLQTGILILGAITIAGLIFVAFRMRAMAMIDELTRLPNRRSIFALAEEQLQTGRTFSLLAIDIDHFKFINDSWGHAAGDLVLQRVAQTCRSALRRMDAIGRIGGEEFLALLPSTSVATAKSIAEQLREAVEQLELTYNNTPLRVTISIGVTESAASDEPLSKVTHRADALLYAAKERGRNRVAA
jgi:diguanylate cyclase (GGDEF)-like protein